MKKFDTVEITWIDSCSDDRTWVRDFDFEEHEKYMFHTTKGFFVKKTKLATFVCQSKSNMGNSLGGMFAIPNSCIKKMVKI